MDVARVVLLYGIFASIPCCFGITIDGVQFSDPVVLADLQLRPISSLVVEVGSIPPDAAFLVVQAHVQWRNVSLVQPSPYDARVWTVTGPHVAQVIPLRQMQTVAAITVANPWPENVTALLVVTVYADQTPMPGGCSLVDTVPYAPFLRLHRGPPYNWLTVPRARRTVNRTDVYSCDSSVDAFDYRIYVSFPPPGDLRVNYSLFRAAIASAVLPAVLAEKAFPVGSRDPLHPLTVLFATHECQSAVYSVLVEGAQLAVYAPVVYHACPLINSWSLSGCPAVESPCTLVLAITVSLCGLALLLSAAPRRTALIAICTSVVVGALLGTASMVIGFGSVGSMLVGYISAIVCGPLLAARAERWLLTLAMSISVLCIVWTLTACLLFIPQLQFDFLAEDLSYWTLFILFGLFVYCASLPFNLHKYGDLLCCVLGSVWLGLGAAVMSGSVLQFAFIDLYRRAVYPRFRYANIQLMLQGTDVGVVVFSAGVLVVSLYLTIRGRARPLICTEFWRIFPITVVAHNEERQSLDADPAASYGSTSDRAAGPAASYGSASDRAAGPAASYGSASDSAAGVQ